MALSDSNYHLTICSDIHVPQMCETVSQNLKLKDSVSKVIDLIAKYIGNDIAPYVIGLPLKKIKKKKKVVVSKKSNPECMNVNVNDLPTNHSNKSFIGSGNGNRSVDATSDLALTETNTKS